MICRNIFDFLEYLIEDTSTNVKQEMQPLSSPENEQTSDLQEMSQTDDAYIKKGLKGYQLRQQRLQMKNIEGKNKLENAIEKIKSIGKEFEVSRVFEEKEKCNVETNTEKDNMEAEQCVQTLVNEYEGDDSEAHEDTEMELKEVKSSTNESCLETDDNSTPFVFLKESCPEDSRIESESCNVDSSEHENELMEDTGESSSSRHSDDKSIENEVPVSANNNSCMSESGLHENDEVDDKEPRIIRTSPSLKGDLSDDAYDSSSICQNQEIDASQHPSIIESKDVEQDNHSVELIEKPVLEESNNDGVKSAIPNSSDSFEEDQPTKTLEVDGKESNPVNDDMINDNPAHKSLTILSVTSLQDASCSFDEGDDKNPATAPEVVESSDELMTGNLFQSPREGTSTEETDLVIDLDKDKEEDNSDNVKTSQTRRPFGGIKLMEKKANKEKGGSTSNNKSKKSSIDSHAITGKAVFKLAVV